jgi:hypothetical protein
MLLAFTHCTRREPTTQPILTAPTAHTGNLRNSREVAVCFFFLLRTRRQGGGRRGIAGGQSGSANTRLVRELWRAAHQPHWPRGVSL